VKRRLVALVGATATGKTALGERLAGLLGGAVVCADARQVFRELEIGTGKPTPAERARLPHQLFDLHALGDHATAGRWARAAADTCEALFAEGVTPVLVGGSGLYLSALQRGLHPEPPKDAALRAELEREWESLGAEAVHAKLAALDPQAATALRVRDRQRVLRALEVVQVGGHPLAWWRVRAREAPLAAEWRTFELTCPPVLLSSRILERARAMWAHGLPDEVRGIVEAGKGDALRRLAAIGYDEALDVIEGKLGKDEAIESMAQRTRQLAKRQRTWFRHQLDAVRVEAPANEGDVEAIAERVAGEVPS
jgi:tRNA dimethylallyltransferase